MRFAPLLVLIFGLAISCIDDKDYNLTSATTRMAIAIPVAYGDLTIQDLLKSSDSLYVKVYPDDLVYLAYSDVLTSRHIRDLFSIPDKTISQSFKIPQGTIPAHSADIRTDSLVEVVDLNLNPEQLSHIDFKSGTINFSSSLVPSSNLLYDVVLTSADLKAKSNGQPLFITTHSSGSLPLADYEVNLNKNKFDLKMVLIIRKSTSSASIGHNTSVSVHFGMDNMEFNFILGFFGDQTVHPPSEHISIGAFGNSLNDAHISFLQPRITLDVINDYGVPCKVDFSSLEARKNGSSLPLQLSPANPIAISFPPTLGGTSTTPVNVTNAKQILDFAPTELYYALSARINQGLSSGNNFLADTSTLKVKMNVEVPLYGHASGILLKDTATIDLSKLNSTQIQSASLKVDAINQLPLDAKLQLYLVDEHNVVLDSLLETEQTSLIRASSVTASGDLETAGAFHSVIVLSSEKLNKLFITKNLIIQAILNTTRDGAGNPLDVKFKSQYTLSVKVGVLADVTFNVSK